MNLDVTDTKVVLWGAVSQLMRERWGGEKLRRLAREANLGPATVLRIKEQRTAVTLDTLEAIANVFGLEAWQLIAHEGIAGHPPLMRLSAEGLDLAMTLDAVREPTRRAQAYALAMHAVRAVGDAPIARPGAAPAPAPAPTKAPRQA